MRAFRHAFAKNPNGEWLGGMRAEIGSALGKDGGDAEEFKSNGPSKRRDRPYQGGRSKYWVKVENRKHPAMSRVMEAFA